MLYSLKQYLRSKFWLNFLGLWWEFTKESSYPTYAFKKNNFSTSKVSSSHMVWMDMHAGRSFWMQRLVRCSWRNLIRMLERIITPPERLRGKPDAFKCIKGQTVVITTKMPFNFFYKESKLFVFWQVLCKLLCLGLK